jgi:hypothetical protein
LAMLTLRPKAFCGHGRGDRSGCYDQQQSTYEDGIRDDERARDCSVERCASWLKSLKKQMRCKSKGPPNHFSDRLC